MTLVYESNRNIASMTRKYIYRSLQAFCGHPAADDTYHAPLDGLSFASRELEPREYAPSIIKSPVVYPDSIVFAKNVEHSMTGGYNAYDVNFSIIVNPSKKFKDFDRVKFIDEQLGYLNTWFSIYPRAEGHFLFLRIIGTNPEYTLSNGLTAGKVDFETIIERTYIMHT